MTVAIELTAHTAGVRAGAIEAFRAEGHGTLGPVVVVIAALDEAGCIGEVLREIPARACGLTVDTLVVDDGSTDATADLARAAGVHVARLERNCGHGVALRVGYQLAREHGALVIHDEIATGLHRTGPRWAGAVRSNLDVVRRTQRDDGALPAAHHVETGDAVSWEGTAGMAWIPALVETGNVDEARAAGEYFKRFETWYGAPEDVDLAPTSEDGYAAVMAFVALEDWETAKRAAAFSRSQRNRAT